MALAFASTLFCSVYPTVSAQSAGAVRNFYLAVEYDLGGPGYVVFSPQTLVVQQGDQVNITVRNVETQSLQLQIEGQPAVTVQPGSAAAAGVVPAETSVPVFTASTPGILGFFTTEHPEASGQIVVLPSDWTNYRPPAQTRGFTQLALPDFAGEEYDKFFPGIMVVNQGDSVNVSVRSLDEMPHSFTMPSYGVNAAVNPAQMAANGTLTPVTSTVPEFKATKPGVFTFICTTYCGEGHIEMVGCLVVLPTGSGYNPEPTTQYGYLTVKPDFAGEGYDKFIPDVVFANQNDLVYLKVRNTDGVAHSLSLPDFGIDNEPIPPAQNTTAGLAPTDAYITPFFADKPGVFQFFCSTLCGEGHNEMIGYLAVLPALGSTVTASPSPSAPPPSFSPPPTQPGPVSAAVAVGLSVAALLAGVGIGLALASKYEES